MPVMIPEHYVPDLQVRMQLYRRLGDLTDTREIDAVGAELIDRFGPLPEEVEALLKVMLVKALCRAANVEKVEAGPKGAVVTLRNNEFPNPAGLVALVSDPTQHGAHQARSEAGVCARLAKAGTATQGHGGDPLAGWLGAGRSRVAASATVAG